VPLSNFFTLFWVRLKESYSKIVWLAVCTCQSIYIHMPRRHAYIDEIVCKLIERKYDQFYPFISMTIINIWQTAINALRNAGIVSVNKQLRDKPKRLARSPHKKRQLLPFPQLTMKT